MRVLTLATTTTAATASTTRLGSGDDDKRKSDNNEVFRALEAEWHTGSTEGSLGFAGRGCAGAGVRPPQTLNSQS